MSAITNAAIFSMDLKNQAYCEQVERLLEAKIKPQTSGYQIHIRLLPELTNIHIGIMDKEKTIYVCIPKNWHFTIDDLQKRIMHVYHKKSLPDLKREYVNDIDKKRMRYNNKL